METPYGEIPDRFAKDMSPQEMHDFLKRRHSRRTVLKGAGVIGLAAAAGPIFWRQSMAFAANSFPIPQWIAFGPNPATSMYVSWSAGSYNTPATASNPMVRWGLDTGYGASQAASGNTVPVPSTATYGTQPSGNVDDTLYISTLISGLSPATTYHYSVSYDGQTWGPDTTFTTGKAGTKDFRWVGIGDSDSYAPSTGFANTAGGNYGTINSLNVGNGGSSYYVTQGIANLGTSAALVSGPSPDFLIFAGDLSYSSGGVELLAGETTQPSYSPVDWDYFMSMIGVNIPGAAQNVPWMMGVGNHEMEPLDKHGYAGFTTRFNQNYDTTSGSPVTQTFVYGNVAFIQLDGNDLSAEISPNNGYTQGQQTTWLTNVLAKYRAPGSGVDFIVCYFHNCLYCTNQTHGSDGGIRTVWEPIFDQYQVDLVVNGHVHAYERTYPIVNGNPTAVVASGGTVNQGTYGTTTWGQGGSGTTYICAGNAGQGSYNNWYGTSGGGDTNPTAGNGQPGTVATTTEPKINTWSGSSTAKGGTGTSSDVADSPSGQSANYYLTNPYSAYRHANYGFIVVDVKAPTGANPTTTMHIQAVSPSGVVNQAGGSPANDSPVVDSVTISRNTVTPSAALPQFTDPALVVGGAALIGGALLATRARRGDETVAPDEN